MSVVGDNIVLFFTGIGSTSSIYFALFVYFWAIWITKFILSYIIYHPVVGWCGNKKVSVIVPTYKEMNETLKESVDRVLHESNSLVNEVIIVTDQREPLVKQWCDENWAEDFRVRTIVAPIGKRNAVRLGIEESTEELLVIIESDTFTEESAIDELVKPLAKDEKIGGVVGDQLIYKPLDNSINFFNNLIEVIKYRFTIPALSVFGNVTVLGGRCVAFRKKAIYPLMDSLLNEKFLGLPCVSGDDGRVSSLLLCTGWKCVYQRTAVFLTISPPTLKVFMKQRLRWARNSCRRTIRAILCIREKDLEKKNIAHSRFWAYKNPAALFQILTVWANTFVMTAVVGITIYSLITGSWFWIGTGGIDITIRVLVFLFIGMALRRLIRIFPACSTTPLRYAPWLLLMPWYLLLMWVVRIYSIFTMNKQGWITRQGSGAGGFGKADSSGGAAAVGPASGSRVVSGETVENGFRSYVENPDVCRETVGDEILFNIQNTPRTREILSRV